MRTEHDLRAALAVLEEHAPLECSGLSDEPVRQPRLRPRLAIAAVVVAVVAVAVAVPLVASKHRSAGPDGPGPNPEPPTTLKYTIAAGHAPGYELRLGAINRTVQQITVLGDGTRCCFGGAAYVFAPGAFDPRPAQKGHPITVDGRPGYFATLANVYDPWPRQPTLPSIAWQSARGTWALVQMELPSKRFNVEAEELKIARAVRMDQPPQPYQVPFRFGYLPKGLVVEGGMPDKGGAWMFLGDGRPGYEDSALPRFGSALSIFVGPGSYLNGDICRTRIDTKSRTFTVDGRRGCVSIDKHSGETVDLYLEAPGGVIDVGVDAKHAGVYTDAQLKRIATTMTLAKISDPRTWFDGASVMPR